LNGLQIRQKGYHFNFRTARNFAMSKANYLTFRIEFEKPTGVQSSPGGERWTLEEVALTGDDLSELPYRPDVRELLHRLRPGGTPFRRHLAVLGDQR